MFTFADSFDFYTTTADAVAGYWDSGTTGSFSLAAGRFAGSQCVSSGGASVLLTKSSGTNDAVHHIVCAFNSSNPLTGTNLGVYLRLTDNVTDQVSIVFRSDGAILLASGTFNGTVLATYSGAVTAQNTWFSFEFEVVINNTTGRFRARKNGNTTDDFDSGATLNTRPGTNAYANKLSVGFGNGAISTHKLDDLLWRSDPTSVAWMGDIRSYTRMPASDVSVQFSKSPNPWNVPINALGSTLAFASGTCGAFPFTAPVSGALISATISVSVGGTGHIKLALYDNNSPSNLLATSTEITNPTPGALTVTFPTPAAVTAGTVYRLAHDQDFSVTYNRTASSSGYSFTQAYATFPAASQGMGLVGFGSAYMTANITPGNYALVSETLQDGTTGYVYDATVGHSDLYNIAAASPAPTSVVAVTTRGFIEKSDAGARSGAVQLRSGATTAQSTSTPLASSFTWLYRTDSTDPNTGSAWTPAAVDGLQIGQVVTA